MNSLEIKDCKNRTLKWRELIRVEEEMKKVDPSFKWYYHEERHLDRYNEFLDNFDSIMSQVHPEIRDRASPKSPKHDDVIEIDIEDDQPKSSSWAQGVKKKKKMIEIPDNER